MKKILEKLLKEAKENSKIQKWMLITAILTLGATLLIGIGVGDIRGFLLQAPQASEYSINVSISPDYVWQDPQEQLSFKITVANNGTKTIPSLTIDKEVHIYREEDRKERYNPIYERESTTVRDFEVGKQLTFELVVPQDTAKIMFNDKDKHVKLILYVKSIPTLNNQELPIQIK